MLTKLKYYKNFLFMLNIKIRESLLKSINFTSPYSKFKTYLKHKSYYM